MEAVFDSKRLVNLTGLHGSMFDKILTDIRASIEKIPKLKLNSVA
jgi:hypothetical protein